MAPSGSADDATSDRDCPACGIDITDQVTPSGFCRACGHDLVGTAPPPRWMRGGVDLRVVARRQRAAILATLVLLVADVLFATLPLHGYVPGAAVIRPWLRAVTGSDWIAPAVALLLGATAVVVVTRLTTAMRLHVVMTALHALLAVAPCIGFLSLISAISHATKLLRREGLRVGLLGVSESELARALEPGRCRSCGYILARPPGLRCPECGTATLREAM